MPAPEPHADDDKLANLYNKLRECEELARQLAGSNVTFMRTGSELVYAARMFTEKAINHVKDEGFWSSTIPLKE